MKIPPLLIALALAAVVAIPSARAWDFAASSMHINFVVVGEISGTYTRLPSGLSVQIDDGFLKLHQPKRSRGVPMGVSHIAAILVAHPPGDSTRFIQIETSGRQPLDITFNGGDRAPLPKMKFRLPTGGRTYEQLKATWIAFEIVIAWGKDLRNGGGLVYVHAPVYLFTQQDNLYRY